MDPKETNEEEVAPVEETVATPEAEVATEATEEVADGEHADESNA